MRVSREEKSKSHERIVECAAQLLRQRGVENASVADIMKEAGLTHGGFYRHFEGKDDLIAAALANAFDELLRPVEERIEKGGAAEAVASYRKNYLSDVHVERPEIGCPAAALAGDIARGGEPLKRAFGAGVDRMIEALAAGRPGPEDRRRRQAARDCAMLVGAIVIARASDPQTANEVIGACRDD